MQEKIDFTDCKVDISANYGGSDKKRGILYNGSRYMLKLSDLIPDEKRTELNSSYSNSSFSEYISCHILKSMGFDVQETLIGTLTMQRMNPSHAAMGEKTYPAVACKNFVTEGYRLVEFKFIESVVLDSKPPKIPRIEDIYHIFTQKNEYFSESFGKEALKRYWDTFIADALLGNFDRHANNWGYLVNKETGEMHLAPVYDCGSCLYPQISDEAIDSILKSPEEIQMRIDKFPTAALELEDGKKASYKQYISSFSNPDCTEALLRIAPKIDMNKICKIIDDTPGISDIRKQFYKTMLHERHQQIIMEPYLQYCHEHSGQAIAALKRQQEINVIKSILADRPDGESYKDSPNIMSQQRAANWKTETDSDKLYHAVLFSNGVINEGAGLAALRNIMGNPNVPAEALVLTAMGKLDNQGKSMMTNAEVCETWQHILKNPNCSPALAADIAIETILNKDRMQPDIFLKTLTEACRVTRDAGFKEIAGVIANHLKGNMSEERTLSAIDNLMNERGMQSLLHKNEKVPLTVTFEKDLSSQLDSHGLDQNDDLLK